MLTVILDTNIFVADFWLRGTQFGTMLDGLRKIDGQLGIPAVVVDEVVNKFEERHGKARSKVLSSWDVLNRLSQEKQDPPNIKNVDYREWLLNRLDQIGAKILPYPKISHDRVVKRELSRKRPFRKGNGYRDYLIWTTVLRTSGQVVFVTMNTEDFAEGEKIHPDIADDLKWGAFYRDSFHISWSLGAFNEKFIIPQMRERVAIREQLQAKGLESVDLHTWVREYLDQILVEEFLPILNTDYPEEACGKGSPRLTASPMVTIEKVWEREPGRYLVKALAVLPVSYSADFDTPDSSTWWEEENEFDVHLLFTLGGDPLDILDWDVEDVDARYC